MKNKKKVTNRGLGVKVIVRNESLKKVTHQSYSDNKYIKVKKF